MSSALLITLEMSGVLGVVLLFGFWELWSLRRDKARSEQQKPAPDAATDTPGEPDNRP